LMTARDDFVARLSPFDRAARMKTDKAVSEAEFLRFVGANVLEWTPPERAALESAWAAVTAKLDGMSVIFPTTILFIKTTGEEEGGAEYTRGDAIILPKSALDPAKRAPIPGILGHELFHILSRNNPRLRDKLYAVIGFQPCGEIVFPPKLAPRKITNPDAPNNDHCIQLQTNHGVVWAVPILFSKSARYDTGKRGLFFEYLEIKFLVVQRTTDSPSKPATYDLSNPTLLDVNHVEGFYEQAGRNTNYIIHPEEILADNFSLLLLGVKGIASPDIVRNLSSVLGLRGATKP
jgi:hypothetical protein